MTVFIASIYLPKTIHFDLPAPAGPPGAGWRAGPRTPATPHSLFPGLASQATPPDTPAALDASLADNPFDSSDRGRPPARRSADEPIGHAPADKGSPKWGARPDQPVSRACSPPPASLVEHDAFDKALDLGRRGITQPLAAVSRSDSHDRVFQNANWTIKDATQGNFSLRNAVEAAARDGKLGEHTYVGTLGMPTDALEGTHQKDDIAEKLATEHDNVPVFVSDQDFKGHYDHFCKRILWPVFHYQLPDNPKSKAYEDHSWKFYVNVNQAFADTIVRNWKRGDVLWVHDYHLLLVPAMVRRKIPDAKIGFFLHVAFPSSEIFRCLAMRFELLDGMLGANLVGFHIHEYTRHFLQTCSRLLTAEATPDGVQLEERFVNVVDLPIGIDPVNIDEHRHRPEVRQWLDILRQKHGDKKIIIARDKLDHVRGVRQKLLAYELFLHENPEWHDKVLMIQVALSTPGKGELDATVSDIVTRINSSFTGFMNTHVLYLKQDIGWQQYLALLAHADCLMITTQREGMNLTSHEYIFCQDGDIPGTKRHSPLILSEFVGTSSLFAGNELSVNPWDYRECANAINSALCMTEPEKGRRWEALHKVVSEHTGANWFGDLMMHLDRAFEEQNRRDQAAVPRLSMPRLLQQYQRSQRRLFILDYEGTLVSWGPVSQIVSFSLQRPINVLNDLLLDDRNTVYVMSGRTPEELDRIFRRVPNLGLIAENGCFIRDSGGDTGSPPSWDVQADMARVRKWKESVTNIMTYYLERTPGAEIEERRCSLILHYKHADDYDMAQRQAASCASHINDACEAQRVHAVVDDGQVVVEPLDWTKATAAGHVFDDWRKRCGGGVNGVGSSTDGVSSSAPEADFLMVVGDGREDEKVFRWANATKSVREVVTVTLGNRNTEATATLAQGVNGVLSALQKLSSV